MPDPAKGIGGAVFNLSGAFTAVGSTFAGNAADSDGGASIYNLVYDGDGAQARHDLRGTIVAGGRGSARPRLRRAGDDVRRRPTWAPRWPPSASSTSSRHAPRAATGTIIGTALTADPQLGPLQSNGGPTQTMAPAPTSPAIDAGSAFGLTTDQRGQPRPFDSPFFAQRGRRLGHRRGRAAGERGPAAGDGTGRSSSAASAAAAAAAAARRAFGARTLVTLRLRTARVSADGRVSVVVANANRFAVRATLSGATTKAVAVGRKRRRVTLKARTVDVAPAARARRSRCGCPRRCAALLRRHGKLSLRLQAKVRDPAGNTRVVTKAVAARAARAHRG